MLTRRLIVCLDVKGDRVVKGVRFEGLRDVGDPVALSERYEAEGADEITFLDISASAEERATLLDMARRTAERMRKGQFDLNDLREQGLNIVQILELADQYEAGDEG